MLKDKQDMKYNIDHLSDASTIHVPPRAVSERPVECDFNSNVDVLATSVIFDRAGRRHYKDVNLDSNFFGAKDSKNTALTVTSLEVHTVSVGNDSNLSGIERLKGVGYVPLPTVSRPVRMSKRRAEGDSGLHPNEGGMKTLMDTFDAKHHINAMQSQQFKFGGTGPINTGPAVFLGGRTEVLPKTTPYQEELDKTIGLNDVDNRPQDPEELDKISKRKFMQSMSKRFLSDPA